MNSFLRLSLFRVAAAIACLVVATVAADKATDPKGAGDKKPLPSAKEVLDRYAEAIGGKDVFKKNQSQHGKGTVEMKAQGITGKMEAFAARPNKLLMKMTIPGAGEFNTGFDGKVAWMSTALTGAMLLEGKMRDQVAAEADFDHALHAAEDYKAAEVLGVEEFNGEPCYKLKLVHETGFESTEFFSVKTGLQRGTIGTQESPLGPVTSTTLITDYKQFDGVLMASRISQKMAGVETIVTMNEMEFNTVDPAVFELPQEVKTLLEASAESQPDASTKKNEPAAKGDKT
ncbi:MAG: DUF620 domain-containing protein, partial [Limisphaerales bacterium]